MDFKAPVRILYEGDVAQAKRFTGIAQQRVAILERLMNYQSLDQYILPTYTPAPGVIITTTKMFGQVIVKISAASSIGEVSEFTREESIDLRFFVRVGTVTYDDEGAIAEDHTRYYWVDFRTLATDGRITFYGIGQTVDTEVTGDTIVITRTPGAARGDLLYAVTMLENMQHGATKAFDLTDTDEEGNEVSQRFVAGYHYLANNHRIKETITSVPSVGDLEPILPGEELVVPANRFYVDTDSRVLAWYRVKQTTEYDDTPVRIGTGTIGGLVKWVDYDEGEWSITGKLAFSLSGEAANSQFGISSVFGTTSFEPLYLVSDISSMDRDSITLSVAYLSTPILFTYTYSEDSGIYGLTGAQEETSMSVWEFSSGGFSSTQGANCEGTSGSGANPALVYSESFPESAPTCVGVPYDECDDVPRTHTYSYASYDEETYDYGEGFVELYIANNRYPVHNYDNGEDDIWQQSYVQDRVGYCGHPFGYCQNGTSQYFARKSVALTRNYRFGTVVDAETPAQNVYVINSENKYSNVLYDLKNTWNSLTGNTPFDPADMNEFASYFVADPPISSSEASDSTDLCTTSWYSNFPFRYADDYGLDDYPFSYSWTYYPSPTGYDQWKVYINDHSSPRDETDTIDLLKIPEIGFSVSVDDVNSVRYLDDRSAADTHGLVIAIKGAGSGSSYIYWNGTNVLSQMLSDMGAQGVIRQGESFFDIGLI